MTTYFWPAGLIALGCLLSACGGGGSGGGSGTAVSPPAAGATGGGNSSTAPTTPTSPALSFNGSVALGSPTGNSIKVNVFSADQSGTVSVAYGSSPAVLMRLTERLSLKAGTPVEFTLNGLNPNERHYYQLSYQADANSAAWQGPVQPFQTARAPGSSFTFAIQGDSHPERPQQFTAELYARTLDSVAADAPDFYILMGDDFSIDTIDPSKITRALVTERYTQQRPWLHRISRSTPLFLVNGNHEQAARYLLDGTPDNVAVWAQNARNSLYSQPAPDDFYSGNTEQVPFIGLLRNHYAWTWGDALFVVLDPYWSSPVAVDNVYGNSKKDNSNMWDVTHGDAQYAWLKRVLESSKAAHKFVFAHHVMGTGRGGVELAGLWEWGGSNAKGVDEMKSQRPTWATPIHQLFVQNKVKIFFQGHDHVWVRQQLDGVVYQTLSQPADPNYALYFDEAYKSGEKHPNTGYTRVTVSPTQVRVEYVRSLLPKDETAARRQGSVVTSYTLP
ncbi:MAG: metallophosphoesterase [Burkholderiales bacterium]|nr:metallophosphoesterase [Burkholderiales bacterium]